MTSLVSSPEKDENADSNNFEDSGNLNQPQNYSGI
jgi:hypothetical protein